jgi:hypothetical protein
MWVIDDTADSTPPPAAIRPATQREIVLKELARLFTGYGVNLRNWLRTVGRSRKPKPAIDISGSR